MRSALLHDVGVWWAFALQRLRAQMHHRASFALQSIGQLLLHLGDFAALAMLAHRFGSIAGWSLAEVGVFYALVSSGFALTMLVGEPLSRFDGLVRDGGFDAVLLRPAGLLAQITGSLDLRRVGMLAQALAVLIWASQRLDVDWSLARAALAAWTILGGGLLFLGILVLQAAVSFRTVEGLEVFNVLTYGGVAAASQPMAIYSDWLRRALTWVVPLAAIGWYPVLAILGRPEAPSALAAWCAPLAGPAMLGAGLLAWRAGVRRYRSTGS